MLVQLWSVVVGSFPKALSSSICVFLVPTTPIHTCRFVNIIYVIVGSDQAAHSTGA